MDEASYDDLINGIPLWLMEEYLHRSGASFNAQEWVHPAGWRAQVSQAADYQIGALRVGRIHLTIRGTPQSVKQAIETLKAYLVRAGG
ncbi:MAG: hypothetical protein ACK4VW_04355 [Anaerolineales bacterium]